MAGITNSVLVVGGVVALRFYLGGVTPDEMMCGRTNFGYYLTSQDAEAGTDCVDPIEVSAIQKREHMDFSAAQSLYLHEKRVRACRWTVVDYVFPIHDEARDKRCRDEDRNYAQIVAADAKKKAEGDAWERAKQAHRY